MALSRAASCLSVSSRTTRNVMAGIPLIRIEVFRRLPTVTANNMSTNRIPNKNEAEGPAISSGGGKPTYAPVNLAHICYERKNEASTGGSGVSSSSSAKKRLPPKSPVVIQHTLFGCKENWKKAGKEINSVTKRTVLAVDCRNHGESPYSTEMSFGLMAKDIRHLCKQLNFEKMSFMGHNMGGTVGMMVAMLYPQILDKLVVVDASPLLNDTCFSRYQQMRKAVAVLKTMEPELRQCHGYTRGVVAAKAIECLLPDKRDVAFVLSNLINDSVPHKYNKEKKIGEGEVRNVATGKDNSDLWRVNLDSFLANPDLVDFPAFDGNLTYEGKTLFIQGTKSSFVNIEDEPKIRQSFPNAQFVWLKDCGRWLHVEKHEEFMQAVIQFLEIQKKTPATTEQTDDSATTTT